MVSKWHYSYNKGEFYQHHTIIAIPLKICFCFPCVFFHFSWWKRITRRTWPLERYCDVLYFNYVPYILFKWSLCSFLYVLYVLFKVREDYLENLATSVLLWCSLLLFVIRSFLYVLYVLFKVREDYLQNLATSVLLWCSLLLLCSFLYVLYVLFYMFFMFYISSMFGSRPERITWRTWPLECYCNVPERQ